MRCNESDTFLSATMFFFNSEYNNSHDPSLPHKVKLRLLFFIVLTEGGRAAKTVTNMDSPFPSKVAV